MNNNSNNSNNSNLGPSLSQGQIFRKQQQTRVLTNNDVVTGNTTREQNKNKVNKQKNGKTSMATIEPFSQKNSINNNISSDNYIPVSKKDIELDDERIKKKNQSEKAKTQQSIKSYSNVSSILSKFQQGVTNEAKAYNNINKNPGLLNKNYSTADSKTIRVNNAGVINTLDTASGKHLPVTPGINISTSIQNPEPAINYIPVENIPAGLTKGSDAGLYGTQSATSVSLPTGVSPYKLEGENVFVAYPYPNGPADINKNMVYYGAYTIGSATGLSLDSEMPKETTLNCLQRAVDKGYSWCGMTQYGSAQGGGGGGKCVIVTPTSLSSHAYKGITISQSGSNTILKHPTGYTTLTFGADGVLYSGHDNYKFAYPLTKIFSSELEPTHGGTINNLVGSYAYNQGRWQNLSSFSGNSDPTGQPSGTFNTLYQYNIQVPNTGYYTYYYYDWMGQQRSYQAPYIYYTTRTEQQLAAPNTSYGNLTYINYNCGKVPTKTPINIGGQNAGAGYNISCMDLHSKYPSFTLELSDTGILTITNNTSAAEANTDSKKVTHDMSFKYETATLSNKQVVTLNMPRPDWVSGGINNTGQPLTASSKNIHSITNGQWISSPNGYCRLILTNGTLHLEYSLQDVSQDKDGNLVGSNSSSVAVYYIQNVNSSNLGATAHIDINGAVNPYPSLPSSITAYDNKYTEMKGYIPNPSTLNKPGSGNVTANSNDSQCRIACNNDPTCAGYVVYDGLCVRLTADKIFPAGDRIANPNYSTYIRHPMFPQNDKSCRNKVDAVIDSNAYSYYLGNGITPNPPTPMTQATKCNLGKVLDSQMKELDSKNQQAVAKGDLIKGQFKNLFERENKVLNSISDNRTTSKIYDEHTKKATDKIQSIKNAQITKSAVEKDSDLLLVSDNYRYVMWGIVSLLLSIAVIKGLRAASD
jgi:hypothetical protein